MPLPPPPPPPLLPHHSARLLQLVRGWLAYRLVSIYVAIHPRAVVRLLCRRRFPRSDCLAAGQSQRAAYARLLLPIIPSPEKRMSAGKAIIPVAAILSSCFILSHFLSTRNASRRLARGKRQARETEMSRDCNWIEQIRSSLRATFITCREHIGSQSPSTCQLYTTSLCPAMKFRIC